MTSPGMVRCTAKKTILERVGQWRWCERLVTRLPFKFFAATVMAQSLIADNVLYMDAITYSKFGDTGLPAMPVL
jgi:hypothetical protein